ncbi:hypothetical protein AVEN_18237-1 [Araneus ventricosus]|uniref:Uncharacterized protein n=1 Tax=Araneus ventricosus TaxID=182803 RepID=A0A4Y2AIZ7_ARAVE|nr:hypothetical protein AVEN_18237-1 [Araneus ventricosus]
MLLHTENYNYFKLLTHFIDTGLLQKHIAEGLSRHKGHHGLVSESVNSRLQLHVLVIHHTVHPACRAGCTLNQTRGKHSPESVVCKVGQRKQTQVSSSPSDHG